MGLQPSTGNMHFGLTHFSVPPKANEERGEEKKQKEYVEWSKDIATCHLRDTKHITYQCSNSKCRDLMMTLPNRICTPCRS